MNCPGCKHPNDESATACTRCGALLHATAPAPSGALRHEPTSPDPRVPSWPNRAILCLLFTPSLTLLIAPLAFHQGDSPDGMSSSDRFLRFLEIAILGLIQLLATVPLAARMAYAPLAATVFCAFALILEQVLDLRMLPLFYVTLGGLGMAWYARSAFTRPWDSVKLFGWVLHGYKRLLAPDR